MVLRRLIVPMLFLSALRAGADIFPTDTPQWRLQDAVSELLDPNSATVARHVACLRLEEMGAAAKPALWALQSAVTHDPALSVRQAAGLAIEEIVTLAGIDPELVADSVALARLGWDPRLVARRDAIWEWARELPDWLAREPLRELGWAWAMVRETPRHIQLAIDFNLDALANGNREERVEAVRRLGRLRLFGLVIKRGLEGALHDADARVREAVAMVLATPQAGQIARRGRWIGDLEDDDPKVRMESARRLMEDGFDDQATMAAAVKVMGEKSWFPREAIASAMRQAWRENVTVRGLLVNSATSRNKMESITAAAALKALDAGGAEPKAIAAERAALVVLLKARLGSPGPGRVGAMRRLSSLEVGPAELVEVLGPATLSNDVELRHQASEALMECGEAGTAAWSLMLKDPRVEVQGLALVQIARLGPAAKGTAAEIVHLLGSKEFHIPRMAVTALKAIGATNSPEYQAAIAKIDEAERIVIFPKQGRPLHVSRAGKHARPDGAEARRLLDDLRADSQRMRAISAAQIQSKDYVTPEVGRTLSVAVQNGDFAVREGLANAIEEAWEKGEEVDETLKRMGENEKDPARKACAKAAMNALAHEKAPATAPAR